LETTELDTTALETTNSKLASDYEAIRRREYELITTLLEVIPRIDGLGEDQVAQMRDALFHADHPYMIVFVGPFSAGKSSLINALLGEHDLLSIGPTPTTDRISILRWGEEASRNRSGEVDTVFYPSPLLQKVSFVDTPGLESVFQKHEDITRRFLHRSDTVLLVMLATQAMTARNLEYLKILKDYGKNVIIVLNQADLLTPEEAQVAQDYVLDQSRALLGFKPEIWLTSGRMAMQARLPDGTIDQDLWKASGVYQIEEYVDRQLSDLARLRQKLQTPLQIVQSVHGAALNTVRGDQSALDHYQSIRQNIDQQLAVFKREQDNIVHDVDEEISDKFGEVGQRGSEAIREMFGLSRAFGSVFRGLLELVGLSRLVSRSSYTRTAFEKHKAFEPIREMTVISDKLAPRIEGRDVQDIDDLVKYARREIEALPPTIRSKVIGSVQAPLKYDRTALLTVRSSLETVQDEAKQVEVEKIERSVRNTLLYMAAYELILLVILVFALIAAPPAQVNSPFWIILVVLIGLALGGLVFLPIRGRMIENAFTERLLHLQARYIEALNLAADKQITYGMQLRREAIAPLTRLIEAQTEIHMDQLNRLQSAGREITKIEADLAAMGRPSVLGIKLPG
jgi:GTP-binding protein EngB required for normal cell division